MLDDFYSSPRVLSRLRECLLGEHLDALTDHLAARGHAIRTVHSYLAAVYHLAYWMESEKVRVAELSNEVLRCFLHDHLPNCGCPVPTGGALYMVRAAMRHVMNVLVARGAVQQVELIVRDPIEQVLQEFMTHLRDTCGLAESTISGRARYARAFLATRSGRDLADLSATQVIRFLNSCALHSAPGTTQAIATSLRSFLRFLTLTGRCDIHLDASVSRASERRHSRIPTVLTDAEIRKLLSAFDRRTAAGRRDFAMAMCMVGVGLRTSEVAAMRMEDLNWQRGTLYLPTGKSRRGSMLPLPAAVQESVSAYVRRGRPISQDSRVFMRHAVPRNKPIESETVRRAIRAGFRRAGLPDRGVHVLRHTAATRMLRAGASLKEIADVLRHGCLDTTTLYTKVDTTRLSKVALPWPEDRS